MDSHKYIGWSFESSRKQKRGPIFWMDQTVENLIRGLICKPLLFLFQRENRRFLRQDISIFGTDLGHLLSGVFKAQAQFETI